ncbi:MAG: hypothetical protein ACPG31_04185 [Planctomycetota bacterium]
MLTLLAVPITAQSGGTMERFHIGATSTKSHDVLGDVNGDGFDDYLSRNFLVSGNHQVGESPVDLYEVDEGPEMPDGTGVTFWTTALGDIDGDSIPDFLMGHSLGPSWSSQGFFRVHSGVDGSLIRSHPGGFQEVDGPEFGSRVGDTNGDGIEDYLVQDYASELGKALLFSGADGLLLRFHSAPGLEIQRHLLGDIDGDGCTDYSLFFDLPAAGGLMRIISGRTGDVLRMHTTSGHRTAIGTVDLNQDGVPDYYVVFDGVDSKSGLWSVSGADGSRIQKFYGRPSEPEELGRLETVRLMENAGDQDGDGIEDILISDPGFEQSHGGTRYGWFALHSGATGMELWNSGPVERWLGNSLGVGRFSGGPQIDIMIGDAGDEYHFPSSHFYQYASHLKATNSIVSASQGAIVDLEVDFGFAWSGKEYAILFSSHVYQPQVFGVALPIEMRAMAWKSLRGEYPFPVTANMQGTLDGFGRATATFLFPSGSHYAFAGHTYWMAAIAGNSTSKPEISSVALPLEIVF